MSRPLRIEYPDAWYLVLNHGRKSANVFDNRQDYEIFVDLLRESVALWNVRITAYCLMVDHYHLLLQTPEANLSRCMRHINGIYTQRYNRNHDADGSLFRGRFKCILLGADQYLLEMVRYIHREPLRAGLVNNMDDYPWSSHLGYIASSAKWRWLNKEAIFSMLTEDKEDRIAVYRRFAQQPDSDAILRLFGKKKLPPILGEPAFMTWARKKYFDAKFDRQVPDSAILAPSVDKIKQAVCRRYGVEEAELMKSRRGVFNEPRGVAIYLTRMMRKDSLEDIAKAFDMAGFSSVSSAIVRVKRQMETDPHLPERIEQIKASVFA